MFKGDCPVRITALETVVLVTSGEVIKPVSSTLQTGVNPKAAELCSEWGAVAEEHYLS